MPTQLLTTASVVLCAHGGTATPIASDPRVKIAGAPAVTLAGAYAVAGCALPPMAGGPCVTGQWYLGTVRVTLGGQPAVVDGGAALCMPTGTPLAPIVAQSKAVAL